MKAIYFQQKVLPSFKRLREFNSRSGKIFFLQNKRFLLFSAK